MFTITLIVMVVIAGLYALRSAISGNKKTEINERMIELTLSIESKKELADKSKCGMSAIKIYEDREKDISSLSKLVRAAHGSQIPTPAKIYNINEAVKIEKVS